MPKQTKRRLRAVAIFVIFLALAWAGYAALKPREKGVDYSALLKDSSKAFNDCKSLNKAQVRLRSLNIGNAMQEMNGIVNTYALEKPLFKDRQSSFGAYVFKIEGANLPDILKKFSSLGTIEGRKEIVDSSLVVKSLSTEEEILATQRKELTDLAAMGHTYGDLAMRKEAIIGKIRDQENQVNVLKQSNTTMLYVQMVPTLGQGNISIVRRIVTNFFGAMLVLFVAVILAYYGTKLLMYLLALMGVKGFSASNMGSYQYGSGNYANKYYSRQGYGGSKRKVKRIYKNKPGSGHEDDAEAKPEKTGK